jgi:NADPH-dependent curcumin reductase CurA
MGAYPPKGPRVHRQSMVNRAHMKGFLVLDYSARYTEKVNQLIIWVQSGQNTGKILIKVD